MVGLTFEKVNRESLGPYGLGEANPPSTLREGVLLLQSEHMKLVITIVQDADAPGLTKALTEAGHQVTKLASTGGFLHEGNTTLLIGVEDGQVEAVKNLISTKCATRTRLITPGVPMAEAPDPFLAQPVEVRVGGAVVFVLEVSEFMKV